MIQDSTPTTRTAAARASLASARAQSEAKQAAVTQAKAELSVATDALMAEGNPATRAALVTAEQNLSIAMVEATGAANRIERAGVELAQAQADEAAATLAKRAEAVAPSVFSQSVAPVASKLARARRDLAECEAEAARLAKGFTTEATEVHGAPRVAYGKILESLTARASGLGAAAVLTKVWGSAPVPGLSAEDSLAAHERGVTDLQHRINALRASEAGLARIAQALVERAHVRTTGDRSTTPLGQFEAVQAEVAALRSGLASLGFESVAAVVKSDDLASRIAKAGAALVAKLVTDLRSAAGLPLDLRIDQPTGIENAYAAHEERKLAQADRAIAALTALGLEAVVKQVKPATKLVGATRSTQLGSFDVDVRA
ncbi:MAG: hypothetical protein ABUL62_04440 [Myxococcales bacterium]